MEDKLKIHWATDMKQGYLANAYGYKVHSDTLRKYVSNIAIISDEARDSVIIASSDLYKERVEGKTNWLFTMSEGTTLPKGCVENIQKADYLLTPSLWARSILGKYFDETKIFVVHHGVEPCFKPIKRKYPMGKPFRFLWVGAPNERKGWQEVVNAWKPFERRKDVELYLKTTGLNEEFRANGNVILDSRNLEQKDMVKLYEYAHCFIFPSRAEGFGLTLAEAMATGLPCIATNYSGITDFFDETVGFPIRYEMGDQKATYIDGTAEITQAAFPDIVHLVDTMIYIWKNYRKALIKGKKASELISKNFTWEKSAKNLVDIITQVKR